VIIKVSSPPEPRLVLDMRVSARTRRRAPGRYCDSAFGPVHKRKETSQNAAVFWRLRVSLCRTSLIQHRITVQMRRTSKG
jgi:hypothetical protein